MANHYKHCPISTCNCFTPFLFYYSCTTKQKSWLFLSCCMLALMQLTMAWERHTTHIHILFLNLKCVLNAIWKENHLSIICALSLFLDDYFIFSRLSSNNQTTSPSSVSAHKILLNSLSYLKLLGEKKKLPQASNILSKQILLSLAFSAFPSCFCTLKPFIIRLDNSLLWGAVLWITGYLAASFAPAHLMYTSSCENPKYLQIL